MTEQSRQSLRGVPARADLPGRLSRCGLAAALAAFVTTAPVAPAHADTVQYYTDFMGELCIRETDLESGFGKGAQLPRTCMENPCMARLDERRLHYDIYGREPEPEEIASYEAKWADVCAMGDAPEELIALAAAPEELPAALTEPLLPQVTQGATIFTLAAEYLPPEDYVFVMPERKRAALPNTPVVRRSSYNVPNFFPGNLSGGSGGGGGGGGGSRSDTGASDDGGSGTIVGSGAQIERRFPFGRRRAEPGAAPCPRDPKRRWRPRNAARQRGWARSAREHRNRRHDERRRRANHR